MQWCLINPTIPFNKIIGLNCSESTKLHQKKKFGTKALNFPHVEINRNKWYSSQEYKFMKAFYNSVFLNRKISWTKSKIIFFCLGSKIVCVHVFFSLKKKTLCLISPAIKYCALTVISLRSAQLVHFTFQGSALWASWSTKNVGAGESHNWNRRLLQYRQEIKGRLDPSVD